MSKINSIITTNDFADLSTVQAVGSKNLAIGESYSPGDLILIAISGISVLLRVTNSFTASSAFLTLSEYSNVVFISQTGAAIFAANQVYPAGFKIIQNNSYWESANNQTSGATFNSAGWTRLVTALAPGSISQNIAKWNNTTQTWVEGLIVAADITNDTITATQIAPNAITSSELANNSVDTLSIIDANVTLAKLAPNSVDSSKIVDNSILSSDLQQIAANTLIGNSTGALANRQTITLGTNLSFSGTALIPNILEVNPTVFVANGPAIVKQINLINTSAARTISAPASPVINNRFAVVDATGSAATNNITITFTGVNLYGVANDTFILNVNRASVEFVYTNSAIGWVRL